jgi:hypothetical protein
VNMDKRKSISKKVRFDIFKRDVFTCQYCGKTPPSIVLEIDHIIPVSKNGDNSCDNLITSCFECNRGKGADTLQVSPQTLVEKSEILAEKEAQIKAYNKLVKSKKKREDDTIDAVEREFRLVYPDREFTYSFRESIRNQFLPYLMIDNLVYAMSKAVDTTRKSGDAIKYFCGICWNMRREVCR